LSRGLSLEALAAELGGMVTRQALWKYEHDIARPVPSVLNRLAATFGIRASHLWAAPGIEARFLAYRKGHRLSKGTRTRIESSASLQLEDRVKLQALTGAVGGSDIPVQAIRARRVEDAEDAASELRELWQLGTNPIGNVTGLLEDHGIHVLEIEPIERFDGLSATVVDTDGRVMAAAIMTRRGLSGERQRFDLAHELGHLTMKIGNGIDEEKAAHRFAGAFLAPAPMVLREFGKRRVRVSPDELLLFKMHFGISVQALLYRLWQLQIIAHDYYRQWCIDIGKLGWRKQEKMELPPERSQWLRRNVMRLFTEGVLSQAEAERMLGVRVDTEVPLSLTRKRGFLALSADERRRLLAEQAERVAEQCGQYDGLGGGDFAGS
jgi:Zn-dependent peptidase ImmA (M78 family)